MSAPRLNSDNFHAETPTPDLDSTSSAARTIGAVATLTLGLQANSAPRDGATVLMGNNLAALTAPLTYAPCP